MIPRRCYQCYHFLISRMKIKSLMFYLIVRLIKWRHVVIKQTWHSDLCWKNVIPVDGKQTNYMEHNTSSKVSSGSTDRNANLFMQRRSSLPCLYETVTGSYSQSVKSSPLKINFNIISTYKTIPNNYFSEASSIYSIALQPYFSRSILCSLHP
jgi:hypothetical protein